MKRMLTVLLVLVMLTMSCALAETLRVGMECDYAPFNWTQADQGENGVPLADGGYADGYDVRIAQRVADYLGYDLEIVKTEWNGLIMSLNSGIIDCIIAGMTPTAERMEQIDFTEPYYASDLVIVVRKDGGYADATSLEDFTGASIVGQLNTFHDTVIDQIPDVDHMTPMEDFPSMTAALLASGMDGYISERPHALSASATNENLTFVAFEDGKGFEYNPLDASISVGVKKGSELTAMIDEALATISDEERSQIMDEALAAQP